VLFLTAKSGNDLQAEFTPVGHNIAVMPPSTELDRLYVLSRGALPRRSDDDERPQLTIFDGNAEAADRLLRAFELDDPMQRLAVDLQGQWVAAFGGDAKVVNPNELVLFDLSEQGGARSRTIRSFGGAPVELLFTQELAVPE